MKFIKQAKTGSASSGPLWFPLNTTSFLAVKGSIGATLDDGGGGIEGGGGLGGGGGDVTPSNSFDFGFKVSSTGYLQSDYATIAGINTPINLRIALATTTPYGGFSRYVNYVETVIPSFPHTFTVSNGDVVYFEAVLNTPGNVIYYNVYNDSDGGTLLTSMDGFQFSGGGTVSEE